MSGWLIVLRCWCVASVLMVLLYCAAVVLARWRHRKPTLFIRPPAKQRDQGFDLRRRLMRSIAERMGR